MVDQDPAGVKYTGSSSSGAGAGSGTQSAKSMLTNVALEHWCGYPKHYHDSNEWLILNYMVSKCCWCYGAHIFVLVDM